MARYKVIDTSPRFLAVDLEKQLLPGSFEFAVHYLQDHEIELSGLSERYRNNVTGAAAYLPLQRRVLIVRQLPGSSPQGVLLAESRPH